MLSPQDYWHENLGSFLAPDAESWRAALMSTYPHFDSSKEKPVRMGGSEPARFLISAERVGVWSPIARPDGLDEHISIMPTSARKRRDWMVDVIMSPPSPPFLVASVGMSSADAAYWRMTTSKDLIAFGGSAALADGMNSLLVDRHKFIAAVDWFRDDGVAVSDLLRFHETTRLFKQSIINGAQARARLERLKSSQDILRAYPGELVPFLMKLASYAARDWSLESEDA